MENNIDYRLLAIKELKRNVKNVEPYDGWDKNDMLKNFFDKHFYNPIEEYEKLKDTLLKDYLKEEWKNDFYNLENNWMNKGKLFLENLENSFDKDINSSLILDFLVDVYFEIRH